MIQNICEEKIRLGVVKESNTLDKERSALLLELCINDYKCFAVYIRSESEVNLSVVASEQNKAEALFDRAVEYELSPIHLDEFLLDFNREWDELVQK